MIKKYTGIYCQKLLPTNVWLDLERSEIESLNEFIDVKNKIYLVCKIHGKIEKPFTTYDLARYGRDYKSITPCSKCDPSNCNHITFEYIKNFVESNDRFATHGNLFELLSTKKELSMIFQKLETKNRRHVSIKVKTLLNTSINKKELIINTTYDKFRKNIGLRMSASTRESWVANLIGFLALKYGLDFESEKSFEGLTGVRDGKLSYDYYFPDLNILVEIDGIQHVEPSDDLDKEAAIEKFNERQIHDRLKDAYAKNSNIKLIRLNAFKKRKNKYYSLSSQESYKVALDFMNNIFVEMHGKLPYAISIQEIIDYFSSKQDVLKRCKDKVSEIYKNNFELIKREVSLESKNSTFFNLKCKRGHVFKVSESKVYLDKDSQSDSIDICYKCKIQNELLQLQKTCKQKSFRIINIQQILNDIPATEENPIGHYNKLKRSEIKLIICKEDDEERTIKTSLIGFKVTKLNWHFQRLEGKIKQKCKSNSKRIPKKKGIILVNNYDKNKILNFEEYAESKTLAQKHNDKLRVGIKPIAPTLPNVQLTSDIKLRNKSFKNIESLFQNSLDFTLVSTNKSFVDNQSYLALKHNECGCVSLIRAFKVCHKIKNSQKLICQFKACYEKQTGKKLAKTRNRRENPPHNKKSDIHKEVMELSNGVLIPIAEPIDVRSNFQVRVNCEGSNIHDRILVISSHDNYMKRDSYQKLANQIRAGLELDSRIKII